MASNGGLESVTGLRFFSGFLRPKVGTNFLYKLLSVALALGFWFSVGDERIEGMIEVPVQVVAPDGLVVANEPPQELSVKVSGTRSEIGRIRRIELAPYRVVLKEGKAGTRQTRIRPEQLSLPGGIAVLELFPSRFDVYLEREEVKELLVQPRLLGKPEDGLVVGALEVNPVRIPVAGAASFLRALDTIYTEPISLEGRQVSFQKVVKANLPHPQLWFVDPVPVSVRIELASGKGKVKKGNANLASKEKLLNEGPIDEDKVQPSP